MGDSNDDVGTLGTPEPGVHPTTTSPSFRPIKGDAAIMLWYLSIQRGSGLETKTHLR